jgi:hypothetical protein
VSRFSFLQPAAEYALPRSFRYSEYIETEQEMWALFPETEGKRVNFCQMGLTAMIFVESGEAALGELATDETYFLMPCPDAMLRPIRMRAQRRLTRDEFRMSSITAARLAEQLSDTGKVLEEIHMEILGPEVLGE